MILIDFDSLHFHEFITLVFTLLVLLLIVVLAFGVDRETGLQLWVHTALAIVRVVILVFFHCGMLHIFKATVGLEGMYTVLCGVAFVSVLVMLACVFPVEYVLVKLRRTQLYALGNRAYSGYLNCALRTFSEDGISAYYTGFPNHCFKIFPYLMMICLLLDVDNCHWWCNLPAVLTKNLEQAVISAFKNLRLALLYQFLPCLALILLGMCPFYAGPIRMFIIWALQTCQKALEQVIFVILRVVLLRLSYCGIIYFMKHALGLSDMNVIVGAIAVTVSLFLALVCIFPLEFVRIQRWNVQTNESENRRPYNGFIHCIVTTYDEGGLANFYTGFQDHSSMISAYLVLLAILILFLDSDCSGSPFTVIITVMKDSLISTFTFIHSYSFK